jgi:farnesyl-diphosphate farnesyltransferase
MADLEQLLADSSRTFALTIPLLPDPTRREVTVAYLLFRVADTLEDSERWPPARRAEGLRSFQALLEHRGDGLERDAFAQALRADPPSHEAGYRALTDEFAAVLEALAALSPRAQEVIVRHLLVTARGMAEGLEDTSSAAFRLRSLAQLERYCYLVAGVVGEMLTELFLLASPRLGAAGATLRQHARSFGEGLQLTNILKDAGADAREERHFIPDQLSLPQLFLRARQDLADAGRYVAALVTARAPQGVVAFTALPVRLALDTLAEVERRGAGAKISRAQLEEALSEVQALLRGERKLEAVLGAR